MTILCISPVSIPNPNFGKKFTKGSLSSLKDCSSSMIRVPCGHCSECIHSRQMSICQRVQMECLSNYLFFATLTYNQDSLPACFTSTNVKIAYADWRDLQLCFKRLRKTDAFTRPFRYLAVSERGSEKGRPHFHILFFVPKYDGDDIDLTPINLEHIMYDALLNEWRRNVGSRRVPIYHPLLTYKQKFRFGRLFRNYDLHFVKPSVDDDGFSSVAFYVTKYMLKRSDKESRLQQALKLNLCESEYLKVWDAVKSRVDSSLFFGLNPDSNGIPDPKIISYLRDCVKRSEGFAKYFNVSDGKSMPLARYYKARGDIYTIDDALRLKETSESLAEDGFYYDDNSYSQLIKSVRDYEKTIFQVADRGDIDNIDDLFD